MFNIDKDVPVSNSNKGAHSKYPWSVMGVGDSFFVPLDGRDYRRVQSSLLGSGTRQFLSGGVRTSKVTEGGVVGIRVWRVK